MDEVFDVAIIGMGPGVRLLPTGCSLVVKKS